jgi:hypothetical protein
MSRVTLCAIDIKFSADVFSVSGGYLPAIDAASVSESLPDAIRID